LCTAFVVDTAKSLNFSALPANEQTVEENCETFLEWDLGMFGLEKLVLERDQFLGHLLSSRGVEYFKIDQLINVAGSIFPFKSIRSGKELTIVTDLGDSTVHAVIYEPDPYRRVLYHLEDSVRVEILEKPVEIRTETGGGIIDQSLWVSMNEQGFPTELISAMEDALGGSVDFFHIQKGDQYKLVFERKYVEGKPLGVKRLIAASYTTGNTEYHSIRFNAGETEGYFDLEGRPMKKTFLKAPVAYSRISSRFSSKRFHPVLKRNKGHFGTDYAAPCGTPIRAVADGRVTQVARTKGNGLFVKIKHDKTYETQYLHMSKFGPGMKPGVMVKQGQTIGYIGQTGLASGCHVCFRFWKNGRQVDHLREKMPPPSVMDPSDLPGFFEYRDEIASLLDDIAIETETAEDENAVTSNDARP
jgi:murein DD-endopeptidase MepM/ murein hydrolase activator NlpD